MPLEHENSPKLLLIMTDVFGELFNALYFVTGCGFSTIFAMRDPLFSLNETALAGKTLRYENVQDLRNIVDAEKPDVVALFSGYLLVNYKIMSHEELDNFIEHLSSRGIPVITSDPFLGFASHVPSFNPYNPFEQLLAVPVRFFGELMFGHLFPYLSRMFYSLKNVPHLYIVDPQESDDVPRTAFFNPNMCSRSLRESYQPGAQNGGGGRASWLFIMAGSEYRIQTELNGDEGFHDILTQKLLETIEEDRRPVLIAPRACVDALSGKASLNQCVFVDTCDYSRYISLLLGAEYAFYWNIFSASIIARLINFMPTFFFDKGHVAETNQLILDKGIRCYYAGAELTYLDHEYRLNREGLGRLAVSQRERLLKPFYENVCRLQTPDEIVQQLLRDRVLNPKAMSYTNH